MYKKRVILFTMTLLIFSVFTAHLPSGHAQENDFTDDELKENDDILYFVNAGDPNPDEVSDTDVMGLFASKTEQEYGEDDTTGKMWGLVTDIDDTATSVSDPDSKLGSLRHYHGEQTRDKSLEYKFELPDGEYDVTLGFKNPWSERDVNHIINGENLSGDYNIGEDDEEKEVTYYQNTVDDGELTVSIQGPSSGELSNYNDPLINYIIVRQNVIIPIADLEDLRDEAVIESEKTDVYSPHSLENLNVAIEEATNLLERVKEDGLDESDSDVQEDIRTAINQLEKGLDGLQEKVTYDAFNPGEKWLDTDGEVIQAHGGGIIYDEQTEKYYWYGEDKTHGYLPTRGVRVYSSTDLYNWEDEGLALTAIESMDQFEDDPLISELYKDRDDKEEIFNDIGTERVVERPKVIYNDKTEKYVMWMHTDGPTEWSDANYAKAQAGYAISDSPTGPFVYQEGNRMDRAPEDADFNGQPDQPGMARDMTLFKDDDGTAYLIYASEENYTLYISKLNDSYTDVVGWHKENEDIRDEEYQAEYGEDYIRLFPGGHREAPAMFKYDGKYYLITSGSTGWDPNRAQYAVADDIFGEWEEMGDPSVGEGAATTFDSQSTFVIPVDPENGKFIYMGDRWNEGDLKNSRYIWLPMEFGQDDEIMLEWYDEWDLETLDGMFQVDINTELTEKVALGETPDLPDVINVSVTNGDTLDTPVHWDVNPDDFALPGTVEVSGILPELSNKTIRTEILVIPENVVYFVNAGGEESQDYLQWKSYMTDTLINKDVMDQAYDPEQEQTWGYLGDGTKQSVNESGDIFSALRYLTSDQGDDITYNFEIEEGSYNVYTGFYDPWFTSTGGSRKADILINDEV
ncbi:MAG TPA: family 43 glycosylhydrolase, partial [Virgibacillus sp.]